MNDSELVLYNGNYWLRNDGDGVTETYASPNSSCFYLSRDGYKDVPKIISNFVPKHRVVVQAGGNTGFYVKQYAEIFETVYTFEPVPSLFYCLNKNVTSPNVFKIQACLGNKRELVNVERGCGNDAGSGSVSGPGRIPTLMIDDLGLDICDIIHLDIEGYEYNALRGAKQTLERCKPIIVIEYYAPWLERFNTNIQQIESFLSSLNYRFSKDVYGDRVYVYDITAATLSWMNITK
jgi:FkbM family methyltransferase